MKKHFITFLFFVYSILGFSQFINNFCESNFTNDRSTSNYVKVYLTSDKQDLNGYFVKIKRESGSVNIGRFKEVIVLNR